MATQLEDLRILKAAEEVADSVWRYVIGWDAFTRDVVGKQLARAADSIGANIAESYGRFHYGEKLQFLYYARGSLFETKYWLNRANARNLISLDDTKQYAQKLSTLAHQLNTFALSLKRQRKGQSASNQIREPSDNYFIDSSPSLFSEIELRYIQEIDSDQISKSHSHTISKELP